MTAEQMQELYRLRLKVMGDETYIQRLEDNQAYHITVIRRQAKEIRKHQEQIADLVMQQAKQQAKQQEQDEIPKENKPVIMVSIDSSERWNTGIWYEVNCWRNSEDCFSFGFFASQVTAMKEALKFGVPVVYDMNPTIRNTWIDRIERGMNP